MQLRIILPSGVFADIANVERIVVMTLAGSFGLLPQRMDCAAVLPAGLLAYSTVGADEVHLAVDGGVLIKTGADVVLCVRRAIAGVDPGQLRQTVLQELQGLSDLESSNRKTLASLESGLIREFIKLHHG